MRSELEKINLVIDTFRNQITIRDKRAAGTVVSFRTNDAQLYKGLLDISRQSSTHFQLLLNLALVWPHWITHTKLSQLPSGQIKQLSDAIREWLLTHEIQSLIETYFVTRPEVADAQQCVVEARFAIELWQAKTIGTTEKIAAFLESVIERQDYTEISGDIEATILSVLKAGDGTFKSFVFDPEFEGYLDQIIYWLQQRLNLEAILALSRAKKRYTKLKRKQGTTYLRRANYADRRQQLARSRRLYYRAFRLIPNNAYLSKILSGNQNALASNSSFGRPINMVRLLIIPMLVIGLVVLWLTVNIVTPAEAVFTGVTAKEAIHFDMLARDLLRIGYIICYAIVFLRIVFPMLTSPIVPEPLRTVLFLSLLNFILPLADNTLWVRMLEMDWYDILFFVSICMVVIFTLGVRDIYLKTKKLVNNREIAAKRTVSVILRIATFTIVYATLFSDIALRRIYYWDSVSILDINATTHIFILPPIGEFGFHIAPSVIILLSFTTLAASTVEEGVISFLGAMQSKN